MFNTPIGFSQRRNRSKSHSSKSNPTIVGKYTYISICVRGNTKADVVVSRKEHLQRDDPPFRIRPSSWFEGTGGGGGEGGSGGERGGRGQGGPPAAGPRLHHSGRLI